MGIQYVTVPQIIQPFAGTLADFSGSAGAASITAVIANPARKYLLLQNVDPKNSLWFNFTTAATAASPSFKLTAGASVVFESSFVTTEALTIIREGGASVPYSVKEGT